MNDFKTMKRFVDDMRSTSSANKKKEILEQYKDEEFVLKCLQYALDPYKMFGVTSKSFSKYRASAKSEFWFDDLFDMLDIFVSRRLTGHNALQALDDFILTNSDYKELILQIIDKDLKTRANASLVNKVFPGLIPVYDVALANDYEEKLVDYDKDEWLASRKLNGLRCVCRVDENGDTKFYSRSGKEFHTLGVLKESIKQSGYTSIIFDGEICIMKGELEDFRAIHSEYNRKNHTIQNPKYFIFDTLTHAEFDSGTSTRTLWDRRIDITAPSQNFVVLRQRPVYSHESIMAALEQADAAGHEGLILRKNTIYKGKRSNDILKLKTFIEQEFVVENVIIGPMRFLEDGEDVERMTLSAVIIKYKGFVVKPGSGFSKAERALYYDHPEQIIGKVITVKYKQESEDKDGNLSLEFPTVKCIHGAERDT